jgi:NAD(P)H dehydrogenase (quinone)
MSLVVTGGTGHLGRLAVEALIARGVPAERIVAGGRNTERIADLADRGVTVRRIDYTEPDTLSSAFEGAEKVLLVSGSEVGQRTAQHSNAVDAAKAAGVGLIVYTSIAHADRSRMQLATEHRATEELLRRSGVDFTLLRNSWYLENYTGQLAVIAEQGAVLGSAADGRVSAATRADYAEAAAAVLASDGQAGQVYELGGDQAFTLTELAAEITHLTGRPVTYRDLAVEDLTAALVAAGLPEAYAGVLADSDQGISRGELEVTSGDLGRLLGRPTTSLREALAGALAAAQVTSG